MEYDRSLALSPHTVQAAFNAVYIPRRDKNSEIITID